SFFHYIRVGPNEIDEIDEPEDENEAAS
ncbi:MAG: hypothetical protein OEM76_14660, partial [Gammaproteobacteria bacterium]|nr:hypothetical protein [Gammaproteobacteria bacterium]